MRTIIFLSVAVYVQPIYAFTVYDPWNFAQNLATVTNLAAQLKQTAARIEHEINSAKRFAERLQKYRFSDIQGLIQDLRSFRNRARAIGYAYHGIVNDFENLYGKDDRFAKKFAAWEKQSDESIKDSMQAQALLDRSDAHMSDLNKVVEVKGQSEGTAETLNAISEINTIQTKQFADLTHIIATDARARQSVIMEERSRQKEQRAYEERLMRGFNEHGPSRPLARFPSLGETAPKVGR